VAEQQPLNNDLGMEPDDFVRASLDAGKPPDQVARSLIQDHQLEPIPAIKALQTGENMT